MPWAPGWLSGCHPGVPVPRVLGAGTRPEGLNSRLALCPVNGVRGHRVPERGLAGDWLGTAVWGQCH